MRVRYPAAPTLASHTRAVGAAVALQNSNEGRRGWRTEYGGREGKKERREEGGWKKRRIEGEDGRGRMEEVKERKRGWKREDGGSEEEKEEE